MSFSKILIPTDGSILGSIAALEGIELAAKLGAEAVGIHVARELQNPAFSFADIRHKINLSAAEYEVTAKEASAKLLQPLEAAAVKAGVKFSGVARISNHAALAIVQTAEEAGCDLIFIGSNGCAGWDDILMGSVTNKVLASTRIPVLVFRLKEEEVPDDAPRYESVFPPA